MGDTKPKKTLSDSDIATYQRRGGPAGGPPGTDADAHVHTDADAAPARSSESDASPATDRDA
ncbi:hypothetical protein [Roseicyclus marinus]|uniref:hypothetical protein n=1 Tax=Roseicyclus marinus TaxID=2161673 RepID=UPI00240FB600|nr:hypothetical protein [Roseicyclus marinus]MDG3042389.1 hypothetical protein [Roseicyclus marinus]